MTVVSGAVALHSRPESDTRESLIGNIVFDEIPRIGQQFLILRVEGSSIESCLEEDPHGFAAAVDDFQALGGAVRANATAARLDGQGHSAGV